MLDRVLPRTPAARILASAALALAVAELAVWLLAPQSDGPDPLRITAERFFDAAALERAVDYRSGQRLLGLGAVAVEVVVLALVASRRPRLLARPLQRADRRPLLGAAAVGAALATLVAVVSLPIGLLAHERAVDVGLSTLGLGGWLWDWLRAAVVGALLAAAGALLLVALQRGLRRLWWIAAAGSVVAYAAVFSFLAPVVIAPLFNDFRSLPAGSSAREDVIELAERAGVGLDEVLSVDASRRSTALNAYVAGLGSSRRVVIYDNLLRETERPVLRSVVAHELGHVAADDIPRGIAFVAIVAPFGLLFVREAGGALAARHRTGAGLPSALPAFALAIALASFALGIVGNQLSRAVEERADRFALELTGDPDGFIELQLELARANRSDPDPPGWAGLLLATHPSTVERIGLGLAYRGIGR